MKQIRQATWFPSGAKINVGLNRIDARIQFSESTASFVSFKTWISCEINAMLQCNYMPTQRASIVLFIQWRMQLE